MQLAEAFRKAIESVGLEKVNCKCFWNIVKDVHIITPTHSFLWTTLVQQEFIMNFLKLRDFNEEINSYISKICFNTGFDLDSVKSLLFALHEGILCSYYGIHPKKDSLLVLWDIYLNNKTRWYERIEEFKDGIIIARKDRYFGVLSVRKEILPFIYRGATKFSHGLACFNDGINFGFINIIGNLEIDVDDIAQENGLTAVGAFSHGIAKLYGRNEKVGYINLSGRYSKCEFEDYYKETIYNDLYEIRKNGLIGLMNNNCEIIVDPQFVAISDYDPENKFFLAKNETNEWFIIKENGKIIKTTFENPSIIAPDTIQDIRMYGNKVKLDLYKSSLGRLVSNVDCIIGNGSFPVLIHSKEGIYNFITIHGRKLNPIGYEMAFPFVSDYTWIKVGTEWRRINKDGDVIAVMKDGDILTKEICGKVLRRNRTTSLIEVYNCVENNIERIIASSAYIILSEIWGSKSSFNTYQFKTDNFFYIWTNGTLMESKTPISRHKLCEASSGMIGKIFFTRIDDISIELLYDGQKVGPIKKKNSTDDFNLIFQLYNGDFIFSFKTKEGFYLYNFNKKKYSEIFTSIDYYSVRRRTVKSIIVNNINARTLLIDSDFKIIAEWDKIERTSSLDYFRIMDNNKYGLIAYNGKIVIKPEFESLNYYPFT